MTEEKTSPVNEEKEEKIAEEKEQTEKKGEVALFDSAGFAEAAEVNLGGESLRMSDLDRIKLPSGGGKSFSVESDGEQEDVKEITGVIIKARTIRTYWKESIEEAGGGNPPDCASDDGITGWGDPGGDCTKCSLGKFTKDEDGKQDIPECSEKRILFIKRDEDLFPSIFILPPTSLKVFRQYMVKLAKKGKAANNVITKITLTVDQNPKGIKYSKPVFENVGTVENPEEIKSYTEQISPVLDSFSVVDSTLEASDIQEAA
ncbi:MAG: hypothetical protein ACQESF_02620 [Nanobdellota archaeon]